MKLYQAGRTDGRTEWGCAEDARARGRPGGVELRPQMEAPGGLEGAGTVPGTLPSPGRRHARHCAFREQIKVGGKPCGL